MNFFKNMSIRTRLIVAFTVTVLLPCSVIVLTSFFNTESQIRSEQQLNAQNTSDLINNEINSLVSGKVNQVEYYASKVDASFFENPDAELFTLLDDYLATNKDTLIAYVGTADGVMLRRPYFEYDASYNPTERNWYIDAVNAAGQTVISNPYTSASTGELVITISKQLRDKSGVIGIDLSIQTIADIANSIAIGNSGYFSIIDQENNELTSNINVEEIGEQSLIDYLSSNPDLTVTSTVNSVTNWDVVSVIVNSDSESVAFSTVKTNIITVAVCLLLSGVITVLLIRSIMVPLRRLTTSTERISQGDLTTRVEVTTKDEFGKLSEQFNTMRDNLHQLISEVTANTTIVQQAANQLSESTTQSIHATTESAVALQKVAENNELQLINSEKIDNALQTVQKQTENIEQNSVDTAKMAEAAISNAQKGNETVEQTVEQMNAINTAFEQSAISIDSLNSQIANIDTIVEVINDIANQTNLLALNASIEAARAGEHGKGFAVVANEVKNLAESSQRSTEQISKLIQAIQGEAKQLIASMNQSKHGVVEGMEVTAHSAQQFKEILTNLNAVAPYMDSIVEAANEMKQTVLTSSNISNETILQAKENAAASEEVAAASEEIHASMEDMNYSASQLQEMANSLQQLVGKFKI